MSRMRGVAANCIAERAAPKAFHPGKHPISPGARHGGYNRPGWARNAWGSMDKVGGKATGGRRGPNPTLRMLSLSCPSQEV
jgi:hypothetical protein